MNANTKWKVCVRCFTYNQAAYITDALDGFAMQQTDFPYVCTIVDDASTDGEPGVIRQYLADHFDVASTPEADGNGAYTREMEYGTLIFAPHRTNRICSFAVLLLKENHYSIRKPKLPYLTEWTDGVPYIALCEGDDYWTSPVKLQTQVAFLDSHPDYGMCYTKVNTIRHEDGICLNWTGGPYESFNDLLVYNNCIPTCTIVARKKIILKYHEEIQPEKQNWLMGDYPHWLYISLKSKIKFIDEKTGVYRILNESASHSKSKNKIDKFARSARDIQIYFWKMGGSDMCIFERMEKSNFFRILGERTVNSNDELIQLNVEILNNLRINRISKLFLRLLVTNKTINKLLKLGYVSKRKIL